MKRLHALIEHALYCFLMAFTGFVGGIVILAILPDLGRMTIEVLIVLTVCIAIILYSVRRP